MYSILDLVRCGILEATGMSYRRKFDGYDIPIITKGHRL